MIAFRFYHCVTRILAPVFDVILKRRQKAGKESLQRIDERRGATSLPRPDGALIWLHAASVGEAQSALIVIGRLLARHADLRILVTTGTQTSAALMEKKLPERAFHQFYPLDRPDWVDRFLDHWRPDVILWMESELWPNMLHAVRRRSIPAYLLNGRMSERSAKNWASLKGTAQYLIETFKTLLVQSESDAEAFRLLGHADVRVTGNIKLSAEPLPFDDDALTALKNAISERPIWVYASTHAGEEALACETHKKLRDEFPGLLSIIVPRHPERAADIQRVCVDMGVSSQLRSQGSKPPLDETEIYVADTLGELGLFYSLAPIAVIGRSFSDDGGGGHNPIEACQLGAVVLTGPHIQYQHDLFDPMIADGSAVIVHQKSDLAIYLKDFLSNPDTVKAYQDKGQAFIKERHRVVEAVEAIIYPAIDEVIS